MLLMTADRGGSQLYLPMLVDKGIGATRLGQVNLWIGAPVSILGSILGGLLLSRMGIKKVFAWGCLGAAGLKFFSAGIALCQAPALWQIGILLGGDKLLAGIIYVLLYHMVMCFSAGPRSATHYAVLSSLPQLFGLAVMPVVGRLGDIAGYFHLYTGFGGFGLLVFWGGAHMLQRRLAVTCNN